MTVVKNSLKLHARNGYLLYIDIIGYSEIVTSNNYGDIDKLEELLLSFQPKFLSKNLKIDSKDANRFNINYFGDSILIFYDCIQDNIEAFKTICEIANYIQSKAIENGFMTRGVIIYGEHKYNKHIKFGKSLVDVNRLEKYNLSPSVCLSPELKKFAKKNNVDCNANFLSPFGLFDHKNNKDRAKCFEGLTKIVDRLTNKEYVDDKDAKKVEWLIDEYNRYFTVLPRMKLIRLPSAIYKIDELLNLNVGLFA